MYSDHIIGVNEHLGWISRQKQDEDQIVFVVLDDRDTLLGVVGIGTIDRKHAKSDWAFYLSEDARGGLGSALELAIIDFAFNQLLLEKLNCEVIEGNNAVVKMHKRFQFEEEGFRRSNVVKDGSRKGVHLLGLTREAWFDRRGAVLEEHSWVVDKFDVSIRWQAQSADLKPIDKIEAARARNNLNWMSILRLAMEVSPDAALPIVDEIKRIDREISSLTDQLTSQIVEPRKPKR